MRAPENANAAPLAREGGAAAKAFKSKDEQGQITFRIQSWQDIASLTERLHLVADYQDHLRLKIRWAQLKFDLGLDVVEIDHLVEEVQDFKAVCQALSAPSGERSAA